MVAGESDLVSQLVAQENRDGALLGRPEGAIPPLALYVQSIQLLGSPSFIPRTESRRPGLVPRSAIRKYKGRLDDMRYI
jgi:hypothetical protein